MPSASIGILQAGVDIERFFRGEKDDIIRMVYHGRVDNSRNLMLLPRILEGLQQKGIDATLHIHGIGDATNRLQNIGLEGLEVTESITQSELANLLSSYDVGLLPMPVNSKKNDYAILKMFCQYTLQEFLPHELYF